MRPLLVTALLLPALLWLPACHSHPTCENCPAMNPDAPVYRHVVVFKFKDSATDTQIDDVIRAFADLENQIETIIGFEHGVNVSPEGLDRGFTHVFLVTFQDKAGLDVYLPHPAHKAFVAKLNGLIEQPFVVDYVAE